MPKRKKYPRLPNAYGSIRYLGKNRTNPYAVHPPCTDINDIGDYVRPKAICYVDDWYVGFAVLNAYHAGTYKPGDEVLFKSYRNVSGTDLDAFCERLLTDFSAHRHVDVTRSAGEKTFAQVYEDYFEYKYGEKAAKKLSRQSMDCTRAAFKNCRALHDRAFRELRYDDLQQCVDSCPLKKSSIELIITLIKQMYRYAELYDLCDRNYSSGLRMPDAEENEHGVAFTEEELRTLWANKNNDVVEMILIMCYSGYRISAYQNIETNTKEWYFRGGVKTAAGKDRVVPIHSAIQKLVAGRICRYGNVIGISVQLFRKRMYEALAHLNIDRHTPHDCRHTFSMLCERYNVSENDRKRMLGHSFGGDVTNAVYGHRSIDDLRKQIEKIKVDL